MRAARSARTALTANRRLDADRDSEMRSRPGERRLAGSPARSSSTRPISCASAAVTIRPVRHRSSPCARPMRSGSRIDAIGANTPSAISGWPNFAPALANDAMAHARQFEATAQALPVARRPARTTLAVEHGRARDAASSPSISRTWPGRCSCTDAPNEKCPPAPSRQIALRPARRRASAKTRCSAAIIARSMMLPFDAPNVTRQKAPSSIERDLHEIGHHGSPTRGPSSTVRAARTGPPANPFVRKNVSIGTLFRRTIVRTVDTPAARSRRTASASSADAMPCRA